jgi:hypothetical protein
MRGFMSYSLDLMGGFDWALYRYHASLLFYGMVSGELVSPVNFSLQNWIVYLYLSNVHVHVHFLYSDTRRRNYHLSSL